MRCVNHYEREAVASCSHCGKELCAECVIEVNGHTLCKQCIAALVGRKTHENRHAHAHSYGPSCRHHERRGDCKSKSKFLLFILSALPGLGYMYLGLIKRGLFVMSAFFINIWLMAEFNIALLAFLIPIIFFASFFDGFRIKRAMDSGESVTDSVDDFKDFISRHKLPVFGSVALVILLGSLSNLARSYHHSYHFYSLFHNALPAILIVSAGVYFIFFIKGRSYATRRHGIRRYVDRTEERSAEEYQSTNNDNR